MDSNVERILLVHSVSATDPQDLRVVEESIRAYRGNDSSVRVEPVVFGVPGGAAPGATLGTELTNELHACIGAVVFVDDLRPNVAYELGFFHGQGRTVLLLAHHRVDSVWTSISDLAGAALALIDGVDLATVVHAYISRLYDELASVSAWSAAELPSIEHNLLRGLPEQPSKQLLQQGGEWGPFLMVSSWQGIDFDVGLNLLPSAGFKVVFRALHHGADYSLYFLVRFTDRSGSRRRLWLGLTSRRRASGLHADERTFPSQAPTTTWQILTGRFQEMLERGYVFASGPAFYLEKIRVRAGTPDQSEAKPIEVGFVDIVGLDR